MKYGIMIAGKQANITFPDKESAIKWRDSIFPGVCYSLVLMEDELGSKTSDFWYIEWYPGQDEPMSIRRSSNTKGMLSRMQAVAKEKTWAMNSTGRVSTYILCKDRLEALRIFRTQLRERITKIIDRKELLCH